ncbi:MAG: nuclear transport factor 2 family protein [Pseudomonadota bacterium]
MTRDEIKALVENMYRVRLSNEAAALEPFFSEDLSFKIEGMGLEDDASVATLTTGRRDFQDIMEQMVVHWRWEDQEIHDLLIDGENVAARYTLTLSFGPLNHSFSTEVIDFMRVADGRITQMNEFVDTATASSLLAEGIAALAAQEGSS